MEGGKNGLEKRRKNYKYFHCFIDINNFFLYLINAYLQQKQFIKYIQIEVIYLIYIYTQTEVYFISFVFMADNIT